MARKVIVPESQAPFRPSGGRRSLSIQKDFDLREVGDISYAKSEDEESPPQTQSSDNGEYWPVRCIVREKTQKGKKLYYIEWEGLDQNGRKWPREWKAAHEITEAVLTAWEETKKKNADKRAAARKSKTAEARASKDGDPRPGDKRTREPSSSPEPAPFAPYGVVTTVEVSKKEHERYRRAKKRQKTTKQPVGRQRSPILISESADEEEEADEVGLDNDIAEGINDFQASFTLLHQHSQTSGNDSSQPRGPGRGVRRRPIILTQTTEGEDNLQDVVQDEEESFLQDSDFVDSSGRRSSFVVAIPTVRFDKSEYVIYPTPSPGLEHGSGSEDEDEEEENVDLSTGFGDSDGESNGLDAGENQEIMESESDDIVNQQSEEDEEAPEEETPVIEVPNTQTTTIGRREIPDSQSSGRTTLHPTPASRGLVAETPYDDRIVMSVPASTGVIQYVAETSQPGKNQRSSSPVHGNDVFSDVPDISNRIFSQDVRETHKSNENSQGSKGSHPSESRNSIPSHQPSRKISNSESPMTQENESLSAEDKNYDNEDDSDASEESAVTPAIRFRLVQKSVAVEAGSPEPARLVNELSLDQPEPLQQRQHLDIEDEPLLAPRSTQITVSFAHETKWPRAPLDSHTEAQARSQVLGASSPRLINVESSKTPEIRPAAQLDNTQASPRKAPEDNSVEAAFNKPSRLNQLSLPSTDFETWPQELRSSPRTPLAEDITQIRSTASTPSGPIPGSIKPTPKTKLDFPKSFQHRRELSLGEELLQSSPVDSSSLSPSRDYTTSPRRSGRKTKPPRGREMSAGPASPLPKVGDLKGVFEAPLSPPQNVAPRATTVGFRSSPQPALASPIGEALLSSTQSSSDVVPSKLDIPIPELSSPPIAAQVSIDDALLAGSQALHLLRSPVRSDASEILLAVPLTITQKGLYTELLESTYRDLEAFLGLQSTQSSTAGAVTAKSMQEHIKTLDNVSTHLDMLEDNLPEYQIIPETIARICEDSSKFSLLATLLGKLRDEIYSIAFIAEAGKLMDLFEIFLKSGSYSFKRYNKDLEFTESVSELSNLRIFLVPSSSTAASNGSLPSVDLVICIDSSANFSSAHIKVLRQSRQPPFKSSPLIQLVAVNTVSHVSLCLPPGDQASAQELITATFFASLLVRDEVGVLPDYLQEWFDSLPAQNPRSWLKNLFNTNEKLLPSIPLGHLASQSAPAATQTQAPAAAAGQSPARKRVLSLSTRSAGEADDRHKKARIDSAQTFTPPLDGDKDTQMTDGGPTDSVIQEPEPEAKLAEEQPEPELKPESMPVPNQPEVQVACSNVAAQPTQPVVSSSAPPATEHPGDITHVSASIPAASGVEKPEKEDAKVDGEQMEIATPEAAPSQEGLVVPQEEAEQAEPTLDDLNPFLAMEKEEILEHLYYYHERSTSLAKELEDWKNTLAHVQDRFESRMDDIRQLRKEVRDLQGAAETQAKGHARQLERTQNASNNIMAERDQARGQLRLLRLALDEAPEAAKQMDQVINQNAQLAETVTKLEKQLKNQNNDLDFCRDQYRNSSSHVGELLNEKDMLESMVEDLTLKADEVKLQWKQMSLEKERKAWTTKIDRLEAQNKSHKDTIARLEADKKRYEKSRGFGAGARGGSIPPRGPGNGVTQSSPAPTRPGSPNMGGYRSYLRNVE